MISSNDIHAGRYYEVREGDRTQTVYVDKKTGMSMETYVWHGTFVDTGRKTVIRNVSRFVREVPTDPFGPPWLIAIDIDKNDFSNKRGKQKLDTLFLSIRETGTFRLYA